MGKRRWRGTNRHVPLIWGAVAIAGGIALIFYGGWLGALAAGVLFMCGVPAIRTAFQASDREITEFTTDAPLSEESKRRFRDRI